MKTGSWPSASMSPTPSSPHRRRTCWAARIDNSWNYHEAATKSPYEWNDRNFYANYGGINKNVFLHITDKLYQTLPLYSNLGNVRRVCLRAGLRYPRQEREDHRRGAGPERIPHSENLRVQSRDRGTTRARSSRRWTAADTRWDRARPKRSAPPGPSTGCISGAGDMGICTPSRRF